MEYGTKTGSEIIENKDAENKTLLLQITVTDETDAQTVELQNRAGVDSRPADGSRVFFIPITDSYQVAISVDDGIEPADDLDDGEQELYASDSGSRTAKIRFKKDGNLILNDGAKTAVNFPDLQTAFNKLKDDFDALVNKYNAHIHLTTATIGAAPTVGVIAPTTGTGTPSTANIAPAESGTVKVP